MNVSCKIPLGYPGHLSTQASQMTEACYHSLSWRGPCCGAGEHGPGAVQGSLKGSLCYQTWVWHESASANILHPPTRIGRLSLLHQLLCWVLIPFCSERLQKPGNLWSPFTGGVRVPLCYSPAVHGGQLPVFRVPQAEHVEKQVCKLIFISIYMCTPVHAHLYITTSWEETGPTPPPF